MFKLAVKVGIFMLVILGASMFISGGKAAANVGQCPSSFQDAQNKNWGVSPTYNGTHGGSMNGLIVHAYDASTGNNIDTIYHINSGISQNDPYWGVINGTRTNLNARIFQDSAGNFSNRTNSLQSGTNDPLYFASVQCTGWDAFGPMDIDTAQVGNGFVLDCGPADSPTHFWFSNIRPTPIGDGANGQNGYWSIQVIGPGPGNSVNIDHYTEGSMSFNKFFTVTNGSNTYVNMAWHPSNWTLTGNSSVDKPTAQIGDTVHFTHQVKNNGPGTATYSWKVMKKYPGDSGYSELGSDDSNGNVTVGAGGYSPNQTPTLRIPGGASDNNKYCQYIVFTNAAGANTGSGQTNPACVTVGRPCTGCGKCGNPACIKPPNGCTNYTVTDDNKTNSDGKNSYTYITISGTDNNVSPTQANAGGVNGDIHHGDSHTFGYDATEQYVTVRVQRFYNGQSNSYYDHTDSYHCYHASCSISRVIDDGQGPPNTVVADHWFTLQVQVKNDNTDSKAQAIPSSVGGYNFSLTEPPENGDPNYEHHDTGFSLNPPPPAGDGSYTEGTVYVNVKAVSTVQLQTVHLYPDLEPHASLGDQCTWDVPIYHHFTATSNAYSHLVPNGESPDHDNYWTDVVEGDTSYPVNLDTHSWLNKNNAATGIDTSSHPGQYSGTTYTLGGNSSGANYGPLTPNGLDQFCAYVTVSPTDGYVGPDHTVAGGTGSYTAHDCDNEHNEPYFKVLGAGAAADLKDVEKKNGGGTLTCSAPASGQSGLLAGWNDNTNDGDSGFNGINRGAGSQLSSLALLKITGFASAQATYRTSSVPGSVLSFANSGNDAAGAQITSTAATESPSLGGSYGSQPKCVKPPQPKPSVAPVPSPGAYPLNGGDTAANGDSNGSGLAKSFTGNLRLSNTAAKPLEGNTSIFVDGNVYISNNLQLDQAGWGIDSTGKSTVPSFTLTATGNIYIAPGVTQLDGLYASSGTIYTCGQSNYTPMTAGQLYDGCNNQLVFTGSVMADQVKMMRTFGSLRDEKSHPAAAYVGGSPAVPWGFYWNHYGAVPPGYNCANITDPITSRDYTLYDNYLCVPASTGLAMQWTFAANSGTCDYNQPGWSGLSCIETHGYPYCAPFNTGEQSWDDNYLCFNKNISPFFSTVAFPGWQCTALTEDADPNGAWNHGGYTLCSGPMVAAVPATPAIPSSPNLTPTCSHGPANGGGAQTLPYTCAAEVIQFSPELYLGNQTIDKDSNGAVQYDSITSLPPVL